LMKALPTRISPRVWLAPQATCTNSAERELMV
jgi:hypothetical protein